MSAIPNLGPELTIYELSQAGRIGVNLPKLDVPQAEALPPNLLRDELTMPEVGELEVVRHFVRLSQKNYSIDKGFYPLGSCTMKYNPKINEDVARYAGFAALHPLTDEAGSQGALSGHVAAQEWMREISGATPSVCHPGRRWPRRIRRYPDDPTSIILDRGTHSAQQNPDPQQRTRDQSGTVTMQHDRNSTCLPTKTAMSISTRSRRSAKGQSARTSPV